jgi:flagellar basal body rod protein FlgC
MSVMSIASAGMRAASLGLQAAASNVARLPVTDATRLGVAQAAAAGGGVTASVVAAPDDANAPIADLLTAKEAALAFAANATVVRRQDEMLGTLLDRWA